jgi:hypothetical protein
LLEVIFKFHYLPKSPYDYKQNKNCVLFQHNDGETPHAYCNAMSHITNKLYTSTQHYTTSTYSTLYVFSNQYSSYIRFIHRTEFLKTNTRKKYFHSSFFFSVHITHFHFSHIVLILLILNTPITLNIVTKEPRHAVQHVCSRNLGVEWKRTPQTFRLFFLFLFLFTFHFSHIVLILNSPSPYRNKTAATCCLARMP